MPSNWQNKILFHLPVPYIGKNVALIHARKDDVAGIGCPMPVAERAVKEMKKQCVPGLVAPWNQATDRENFVGNKQYLCYKQFSFNITKFLPGAGNNDKLPSVMASPKKTYRINLSPYMRIE